MTNISFDRAAEYYDETRGYAGGSAERVRDAIVAHTGASQATRFLELGVGTGRIALPFIRAGYDYTGVDISRQMMDRLAAKLAGDPGVGAYRYDLREGDIAALPFADASFDVIVVVHVLHLVANWQAAVREARRVLRPAGWLVIGYDTWPEMIESSLENLAEPMRVRAKWDEIQRELGIGRPGNRVNVRSADGELDRYCQSLGAQTERVGLAVVERAPVTPRAVAERLKGRMYSADWHTPDELHAEAARRLDQWFDREIAAPDQLVAVEGTFSAIVAKWI